MFVLYSESLCEFFHQVCGAGSRIDGALLGQHKGMDRRTSVQPDSQVDNPLSSCLHLGDGEV